MYTCRLNIKMPFFYFQLISFQWALFSLIRSLLLFDNTTNALRRNWEYVDFFRIWPFTRIHCTSPLLIKTKFWDSSITVITSKKSRTGIFTSEHLTNINFPIFQGLWYDEYRSKQLFCLGFMINSFLPKIHKK